MSSYSVYVKDDVLYAIIPDQSETIPVKIKVKTDIDLQVHLHAHACLEFKYQGFSLLTDPWLNGPAFLGSWIQYPVPKVAASDIKPDAIWISHEHSDHFHEPTLLVYDRSTPIYVPAFPNKRLEKRLAEMGFTNVYPIRFGETIEITKNIKITSYEPGSLWNDSILLIEFDDFRFLNLNDAGLNSRIASLIGPVDVISSGFSPGASGYPLTWNHISVDEKVNILKTSAQGLLEMLKQAVKLYGAKYVLPFASHFELWHPSHREYVPLIPKNTVNDVVELFKGTEIGVIDILPGESWDAKTNEFVRISQPRKEIYDREKKLGYLNFKYDQNIFEDAHSKTEALTEDEIIQYFLSLNQVPEMAFCEDLTLRVKTISGYYNMPEMILDFEVINGEIRRSKGIDGVLNILIEIPNNVLALIIRHDLSWDEAHIGYWCRFERYPDIYHAGFWRLLQAPYYKKSVYPGRSEKRINEKMAIADLIEQYGDQADRILRRYGLYCIGCQHSTYDSIELGAKSHGVEEKQFHNLMKELNNIFSI